MSDKPDHLGPEYGAQFSDSSVAAMYHLRPPYPDAVFDVLAGLIVDEPRVVLDVGTGTGEIARNLIDHAERIDGVDPSAAMLARARMRPGGDSPKIAWIHGMAESAPLNPPYALISTANSLHWMEWRVVLPRFRNLLTANGVLALVSNPEVETPWASALQAVIDHYSTNRRYRPYNLLAEIESRRLFREIGHVQTPAISFTQSVSDYIASFHARNGFSLDRMTSADAAAFDHEASAIVSAYAVDGLVTLYIHGDVIWGIPAPSHA